MIIKRNTLELKDLVTTKLCFSLLQKDTGKGEAGRDMW